MSGITNCQLKAENEWNYKLSIKNQKMSGITYCQLNSEYIKLHAELSEKNEECAELSEKNEECNSEYIKLHAELSEKNEECINMRTELDKKTTLYVWNSIQLHKILDKYTSLSLRYEILSKKYMNKVFDTNHDEVHYS